MKPTKNRVFCIECGKSKMLFETEKKALLFMKFNNDEIAEENEAVPSRAYFCEACGGWHLTHLTNTHPTKTPTQKAIELMHKQQDFFQAKEDSRMQLLEEQKKEREETHSYALTQLSKVDNLIKNGKTDEALLLVNNLLELSKTKYIKPRVNRRINKRYQLLTNQ